MRRLVLLGAGHAHIEVLRRAAERPFANGEILVICPSPQAHYTGMIPGFVQGRTSASALTIDVAALTRAAHAGFRAGRGEAVAADGRSVTLEGGEVVECDLVSCDVGSVPGGLHQVPGAEAHAYGARPIERAERLVAALSETLRADRGHGGDDICVVGAGAAGVEIALAIRARADRAGANPAVTLIESGADILAAFGPAMQRHFSRILAARRILVRTGADVIAVTPTEVTLASGERVASTVTVWVTGAAPTAVTLKSDLPKDSRGFWLVDPTLRSVGGAPVWGAGDCVSLRDHPWVAKAGVYAVREAPVLAANLRLAVLRGPEAADRPYHPQRNYLAILDTADGRATLEWNGLMLHGRAPRWLKRFIDHRFVRRYAMPGGRASDQ